MSIIKIPADNHQPERENIRIQTLAMISLEQIATAFERAFADYRIPIRMTVQQLQDKIKSEDIHLDLSMGAFAGDQLIGFVLTGMRQTGEMKSAYNAGTGVLPAFRGHQLTRRMYVPLLQCCYMAKIEQHLLEVLLDNERAIRVYQHVGFRPTRKLICYKGLVSPPMKETTFRIRQELISDWAMHETFYGKEPAWQNSFASVQNCNHHWIALSAWDQERLGSLVFLPGTGRIKWLQVSPSARRKGIATQMLQEAAALCSSMEMSVINVDEQDDGMHPFLLSVGMEPYATQWEMHLSTPVL
jgi:ribosomal protein S18 acetylase RimI-like enzyme